MAFLKGSDRNRSGSRETESKNTPEPSKTQSYLSLVTDMGTKDGQRMFPPFTPYAAGQESPSVVPLATNLTTIQQTAHSNYRQNSPPRTPSETSPLTERGNIVGTEWSKGCLVVNFEEGHEEELDVEPEEQPLSTLQQARPGVSLKVHNGEVGRPLEASDPPGGVTAGQAEEGPNGHISGEDLICQGIKESNASIKGEVSEYHM